MTSRALTWSTDDPVEVGDLRCAARPFDLLVLCT
jgi:hypothetical protein